MPAAKLSHKLLKSIVVNAGANVSYQNIVEELDKNQVSYNEPMLQGFITEALEKKNFIVANDAENVVEMEFKAKPRQSTGGGTPTRMFKLKNELKPDADKMDFVEKPYDREEVEADGSLWATTQLAAVKAAKGHFYRTVYWPALEQYRMMEEAVNPKAESEEAA